MDLGSRRCFKGLLGPTLEWGPNWGLCQSGLDVLFLACHLVSLFLADCLPGGPAEANLA